MQSATPTERQDAAGHQTSKKSKSKPQPVVLKKFTSAHVASVQAKLTEHKSTIFPLSPSFQEGFFFAKKQIMLFFWHFLFHMPYKTVLFHQEYISLIDTELLLSILWHLAYFDKNGGKNEQNYLHKSPKVCQSNP